MKGARDRVKFEFYEMSDYTRKKDLYIFFCFYIDKKKKTVSGLRAFSNFFFFFCDAHTPHTHM